jgi:Domain of unknown function (DUF6362)
VRRYLGRHHPERVHAEAEKAVGWRERAMIEQRWDNETVARRLEEAADVLARLPHERVRGLYDLWPRLVGEPCGHARAAAPAPEAIDRMDEALRWLSWLDPEERRLVWLRAEGMPWKWITRRLGIGRTTAWQRWTRALLKIVVRLDTVEQIRPDIKALNNLADSVLERG